MRRSSHTLATLGTLLLALGLPACNMLPWQNQEMITDPNPAVPPIRLAQTSGRHLVVMQVPTGGWTLSIDNTDVTPDGRRVHLTARRPDPAFMHTQALVELRVLTEVPQDTPIELVARVLDRHEKTDGRVYARVEPVESFDE